MIYTYILVFVFWNMLMASVLTIPLYKIVCSLSYIDYSDTLYTIHKEYALFAYQNVSILEYSQIQNVQCVWLRSIYTSSFSLHTNIYSCIERIVHMQLSNIIHSVVFQDTSMQYIDVRFISRVSNLTLLEFISLQHRIIANAGESTLVFFRMYNPTSFDIVGISMYYVFPSISSIYLNKIQCFCFDLLQIYSREAVELPVLFYISRFVDTQFNILSVIISYVYFVH